MPYIGPDFPYFPFVEACSRHRWVDLARVTWQAILRSLYGPEVFRSAFRQVRASDRNCGGGGADLVHRKCFLSKLQRCEENRRLSHHPALRAHPPLCLSSSPSLLSFFSYHHHVISAISISTSISHHLSISLSLPIPFSLLARVNG